MPPFRKTHLQYLQNQNYWSSMTSSDNNYLQTIFRKLKKFITTTGIYPSILVAVGNWTQSLNHVQILQIQVETKEKQFNIHQSSVRGFLLRLLLLFLPSLWRPSASLSMSPWQLKWLLPMLIYCWCYCWCSLCLWHLLHACPFQGSLICGSPSRFPERVFKVSPDPV